MIKVWCSRYKLPIKNDESKFGALLKISWPDNSTGYADLCPIPSLGDAPLEKHLSDLKKGRVSTLLEQSFWLASLDAKARAEKINLYERCRKVKNHFLIPDLFSFSEADLALIQQAGFNTVKVKIGKDIENESSEISRLIRRSQLKIRLDFNARNETSQFDRFVRRMPKEELRRIEFVEDPMPWDPEAWKEASQFVPLALDNEYHKVNFDELESCPFKVLVIKPARQDVEKAVKKAVARELSIVVTSALDHPVGIVHAALIAGDLKAKLPHTILEGGCLSLRSLSASEFTAQIHINGPFIVKVDGLGIGFDSLFEKLTWEPVR